MTSPITADDRAKAVLAEFFKSHDPSADHAGHEWDITGLIAQAIRQAEDEAYERARAVAEEHRRAEFYHGEWFVASEIADAIERLKSPSPPKGQGHE